VKEAWTGGGGLFLDYASGETLIKIYFFNEKSHLTTTLLTRVLHTGDKVTMLLNPQLTLTETSPTYVKATNKA
jgi:hypothetical protein